MDFVNCLKQRSSCPPTRTWIRPSALRRLPRGEVIECTAMLRWLGLIAILLCWLARLPAQDIDSIPATQRRSSASIADEITDPAERSAFLELFNQGPAADMRSRAEVFVARFPKSAFLAQAYEVAARGCF